MKEFKPELRIARLIHAPADFDEKLHAVVGEEGTVLDSSISDERKPIHLVWFREHHLRRWIHQENLEIWEPAECLDSSS